jgi:hypothetical protein
MGERLRGVVGQGVVTRQADDGHLRQRLRHADGVGLALDDQDAVDRFVAP